MITNQLNTKPKSNAILIPMKQNTIKVQKKSAVETTPQIVDNKNINKLIAPIFPSVPSDLIISGNKINPGEEITFNGNPGNGINCKG